MTDLIGSLHFLALIGLTGAWIEARIEPLGQWVAPIALLVFLGLILAFAWAVALVYT